MTYANFKVLKNYPKAFSYETEHGWAIASLVSHRGEVLIGTGDTEEEAWKDALNFGPDTSKGVR